jgi:hypothetical protein
MKKLLISLLALVLSFNLSAQLKDVEIGGSLSYGEQSYYANKYLFSYNLEVLTTVFSKNRFSIRTGLIIDQKRNIYNSEEWITPDMLMNGELPDIINTKVNSQHHLFGVPIILNINLLKEEKISAFVGFAYKTPFIYYRKEVNEYRDGTIEEVKTLNLFPDYMFSVSFIHTQLGIRIKLAEINKTELFVATYYQHDYIHSSRNNAYLGMHTINLSFNLKYNFQKNE